MPARTSIEWADYSSNPLKFKLHGKKQPINLCVPVSPGCANCYAAAIQKRFHNVDYAKRVMDKAKPVLVQKELNHILHFCPKPPFKNGRDRPAVFIGDMTDLFGPWVPYELLDIIFAHCALRPDVDWLFLTKHPERMRDYLSNARYDIEHAVEKLWFNNDGRSVKFAWPMPHFWLGTSAENQEQAKARFDDLQRTPAAVNFVSLEPLLGPLEISRHLDSMCTRCKKSSAACACTFGGITSRQAAARAGRATIPGIDWVIVGGESGAGARECDVEWIRSIVEQCGNAGVNCFVKQVGSQSFSWVKNNGKNSIKAKTWLTDSKGGNPVDWPQDLFVRQMPGTSLPRTKISPERTLR